MYRFLQFIRRNCAVHEIRSGSLMRACPSIILVAMAMAIGSFPVRGKDTLASKHSSSACSTLNTVCVGAGPDCDYSNLQQAIESASTSSAATTIHIAHDQAYVSQNLSIENRNIVLRGGYSSCADYIPSGKTVLSGAGGNGDSVVSISAPSGYRKVTLRGLEIREGGSADGINRGGGVNIRDNVFVDVVGSDIVNNHSTVGGGVYVVGSGGTTVMIESGSLVGSNFALHDGGGVACEAGGFIQIENALITDNRAGGAARNGGGIFLDHCTLMASAGGDNLGIRANHALQFGGGIYAGNNSSVTLRGNAVGGFSLSGNEGMAGGGVYLDRSHALLDSVELKDNVALGDASGYSGRGGGILASSSQLQMNSDASTGSSLLQGNQAATHSTGAALYIEGNEASPSSIAISDTRVSENGDFAISLDGGVDAGDGNYGAILALSNAILDHNGQFAPLLAYDKSKITIAYSTLADNAGSGLIRLLSDSSFANLDNSIVSNSQLRPVVTPDSAASAMLVVHCLIANTGHGLPAQADIAATDAPGFRNPVAGDYHLMPNSPAIDFCNAPSDAPATDLDGNLRGVDAPQVPPFLPGATYDLGAYEWTLKDRIFSNGFDNG